MQLALYKTLIAALTVIDTQILILAQHDVSSLCKNVTSNHRED